VLVGQKLRVCLLTPGQPSTNPRLVKEADALTEAGFDVTVVFAHWADWASQTDAALLKSVRWSYVRIGGCPEKQRLRYWFTRLRHGLSRRVYGRIPGRLLPHNWCLSRVAPELVAAAKRMKADLYIGHNLGALPAAVAGAEANGSRAGFDAEDFHSDMIAAGQATHVERLAEEVESQYLTRCDYLTTASPALAKAYAAKYGINPPATILNVFPVADRPLRFRATESAGPLRLYWFSQTIGAHRGLEDAVRAMGMLGTPDVQLYLQGTWAAGYRQEIYSIAKAAGLKTEQIVHLVPEAPSEIVRRASTFDVGLALESSNILNRDLTITNKIFTYVLAGTAVAATATAGQQAIVERIAPAGVSYAPGDASALKQALAVWLHDRSALDLARRASWDFGSRTYNWDVEKHKFLDVVERALC
jgi:glycosyltransferase involved in cell wall biosynthesis